MTAIFFPLAALLTDLLIIIMFYTKKNVKNSETKIYSFLLNINFLECLFNLIGIILLKKGMDLEMFALAIQKPDMLMMLSWGTFMFLYVYTVSEFKVRYSVKKYSITFSLLMMIVILLSPVEAILEGETINSVGLATDLTFLSLAIYILGIIICVVYSIIKNKENIKNKKYYPLHALVIMAVLGLFLRSKFPEIVFEPFMMGYVVLMMYFTIENPDVKMIDALELAKNQAEKANRAKSDFLSNMSHEIRTPLNAIVGISEIIKNSDEIDEIHEDANDVVIASQNLLEIVNGILDISKIEANKMEVVEVSYNPVELFNELLPIMKVRIGEKPIELNHNFASDIPNALFGGNGKVKQVSTNLLTNAIKYTDEGSIKFNVECINESDLCKLKIVVTDTGRGIKEEHMEKLFTKFNRLEEDKNTTIEGTGLGLAITKSLVEMMGGKIVVQSRYGEGSTFTIFLPQKYSKEKVNKEIMREEKITFNDKRILIVDDNLLNIKVATKILNEYNFIIDSCDSGYKCIEKINNGEKYDIIFMDIMMPKMSGLETFKKIKETPDFNTPVIALTADAIEGKANKYLEVGFSAYLSKPIEKKELNKTLNKIFNNVEERVSSDEEIKEYSNEVTFISDSDIEELNKLFKE